MMNAINGGVISTNRVIRQLEKRGHKVIIFSTGYSGNELNYFPMKAFYPFPARRIMKKMKMPLARPVKRVIQSAMPEMDVMHIMFPFWLGYSSLTIAKRNRVPVISTFHVQVEHIFKNLHWDSPFMVRCGYKLLISTFYNRTDLVICPSRFAQSELQHHGFKGPSIVLSNGVSSDFMECSVKRPKELEGKFIVLTVGRLTPEKCHLTIIKAVQASKYKDRIHLFIFGEGPDREKLLKAAHTAEIQITISVAPPTKLVTYYNMANLYIHASEIETEGMAPLEATACGCPILVSNSAKSATSQFVLDPSHMFKHNDINELTRKLDFWVDQPDGLEEWGKAYASAARQYRIDRVVDTLEQVYSDLSAK